MRHWHMSAHIPIPGGCLGLADCNKPGWRSSSGLSFCPLCFLSLKALALLPPIGSRLGGWSEDTSRQRPELEVSWVTPLVVLVKLAVCSAHSAPEQCITVGPVFRQSDRSQPPHPENLGNQLSTHTSPPASIYILPLYLSVWWSYLGLCLFILPRLESLSFFFSALTSTLLLFSHVSCLSLAFWDSIRALKAVREKTGGGCKNIYGFIYKGPRYCPALNPGEMIYFPPMCGTDPWGVTQQSTGLVLAIYSGCRGS